MGDTSTLTYAISGNLISYEYVPAGKDPTMPRAGDLLFCHRAGYASACIRAGEWLKFRGGDRWSHVACFSAPDTLIEALTRGVVRSEPQEYRFVECVHVRTNLSTTDGEQATKFLNSCVGLRYGFLIDVAIGLRFITPFDRWTFGAGGTTVCSGLAAQMLCRGYYVCSIDPSYISPAELALDLNIPPTLGEARKELA